MIGWLVPHGIPADVRFTRSFSFAAVTQARVLSAPRLRAARVIAEKDGQENASREFGRTQIQAMIKEKTETNNWQFVFLSADLAAIGDARSVGIAHESSLLFEKSGKGSADAWNSVSARTSDYRSARKSKMEFDDEDRKQPEDPEKPKS